MQCYKRNVLDPNGGLLTFFLFWGQDEKKKIDDSCPSLDQIKKQLLETKVIKQSLGKKKFVDIDGIRFEFPLNRLALRLAAKKGVDIKHLIPVEQEEFETIWNLIPIVPYLTTLNRWIALLEDSTHKIIAYAYGTSFQHSKNEPPDISVSFVATHPYLRSKGLCGVLMNHVFQGIQQRFPESSINILNAAELIGYKCYTGAAKKNQYHLRCLDRTPDPDSQCVNMLFYPSMLYE